MPISRYIETSNLARPGVCTSTTRPASPYEGQAIYETDTDKTFIWNGATWVEQLTTTVIDAKGDLIVGTAADTASRLAVGTNRQVLEADSATATGVKWGNPVGMELIAATTFTNSNNMLMNNVFSSAYDNYSVNINITSFSAPTGVFMRMANGTTVDAGSIYLFGGFVSYMGSAILTAVNSGGVTTDWNLGAQEGTWGYGNTPFKVEVMQPFMTNRTSFFSSGFQPVNPQPYYRHIGGVTSNTTSYNGFTIIPNSASFNLSGTIRVYGYRN